SAVVVPAQAVVPAKIVIPAQAGIQLDSRLRGNDSVHSRLRGNDSVDSRLRGNDGFGPYLPQRLQDERTLVRARMRNRQSRLLDRGAPVQDDVEVEGARAVGDLADPPVALLDLEQCVEQRSRREARL